MACGITDVEIHIDGPEVPIIDGSALPFMHLIDAAGIRELGSEIPLLRLREPIEVVEDGKSIRMIPSNRLVLKYRSTSTIPPSASSPFCRLSPRQFPPQDRAGAHVRIVRDVERLRAAGLAAAGRSRTVRPRRSGSGQRTAALPR
jgi:UDP-3-O-[3-hydroxymyristoyl] N-acetylglucosamine deacetylase